MRGHVFAVVLGMCPNLLLAESFATSEAGGTRAASETFGKAVGQAAQIILAAAEPQALPDTAIKPFSELAAIDQKRPVGWEPPRNQLPFGPYLPALEPAPVDPHLETRAVAQAHQARLSRATDQMPRAMQRSRTSIEVRVFVTAQRMEVYHHGNLVYDWQVSTARDGKVTPRGIYTAEWLSKDHRSSIYNDAPMPFAIFYDGHYAIHGTEAEGRLGSPASSGCVRLSRDHAETLFNMVRKDGKQNLLIKIED